MSEEMRKLQEHADALEQRVKELEALNKEIGQISYDVTQEKQQLERNLEECKRVKDRVFGELNQARDAAKQEYFKLETKNVELTRKLAAYEGPQLSSAGGTIRDQGKRIIELERKLAKAVEQRNEWIEALDGAYSLTISVKDAIANEDAELNGDK